MPGSKGLPHPPPGCSHSCPHRCPARREKPRRAQSGQGKAGPGSVLCPRTSDSRETHFLLCITPWTNTNHVLLASTQPRAEGPPWGSSFGLFLLTGHQPSAAGQARSSPATPRAQPPQPHSQNAQAAPSPPASASAPSAPRPAGSREGKQKCSEAHRERKVCEPL